MSLKKIVGQDKAITMLLGMLQRRKVASAYIFCGEPGIGKKTAALNFAKALNCLHPGQQERTEARLPDFDACDTCSSCIKIEAAVHPDVLVLTPEERLIKIDEIRRIEDTLAYKSYEGLTKIIIVDDADTMNNSAANAFLKTLEEPPGESVIILVTSRPDMLPATIRSRCCRISFFPLAEKDARKVLSVNFRGPELELLLRLSMGRPGEVSSGELREKRDWFIKLFKDMLLAEKDAWTSREDMDKWFEQCLLLLRDMAVLKIYGDTSCLLNSDNHDYIQGISKSVDLKGILYIYGELSLLKGLLSFNLNKSVTWNYTAALLRKELLV